MPSEQDIIDQRELLSVYRQVLEVHLRQQAKVGRENVSPGILNEIVSTRNEIKRIKNTLRHWGVVVEDIPSESSTPDTIINDPSQILQDQKNKAENKRTITRSVLIPLISSFFGLISAISINLISAGINIPSYIILAIFVALIIAGILLTLSSSNE